MHRFRLHPLIAVLCALFLLASQQAAYALFLSHLGHSSVETAAHVSGDAGHDEASTLSHVCTTCAAFAALDAAPPAAAALTAAALAVTAQLPHRPATGVPALPAPPYTARAPPAVL